MSRFNKRQRTRSSDSALYDKWLLVVVVGLIIIGLMMVASSSVMVSTKYFHQPFHFLIRQACYLVVGIFAAMLVMRIESSTWEKYSVRLLLVCLVLLLIVLIPGIGRVVNGSRRWVAIGPIGIQVSELAKMTMILYLSGYLVRQQKCIDNSIIGFIKPMIILAIVALLLLMEPDFGATVVITGTVMAMLFLTGVKLRYYIGLLVMVGVALAPKALPTVPSESSATAVGLALWSAVSLSAFSGLV